MKTNTLKKRSTKCYQNKIKKITKWYNNLVEERKKEMNKINKNTRKPVVRKPLKSLDWYISKIKKPTGEMA